MQLSEKRCNFSGSTFIWRTSSGCIKWCLYRIVNITSTLLFFYNVVMANAGPLQINTCIGTLMKPDKIKFLIIIFFNIKFSSLATSLLTRKFYVVIIIQTLIKPVESNASLQISCERNWDCWLLKLRNESWGNGLLIKLFLSDIKSCRTEMCKPAQRVEGATHTQRKQLYIRLGREPNQCSCSHPVEQWARLIQLEHAIWLTSFRSSKLINALGQFDLDYQT